MRRVKTDATDLVVGTWKDGRIGTFRDLRGGKSGTACHIFGTEGMVMGKSAGYQPLIEQIVKSFRTGEAPVPAEGCEGAPAHAVLTLPAPASHWMRIVCTDTGHTVAPISGDAWQIVHDERAFTIAAADGC